MHHIHDILQEVTADVPTAAPAHQVNKSLVDKISRRKLINRDNCKDWEASEWRQLDQYKKQEFFGEPCIHPRDKGIFNLVWTHYVKTDETNTKSQDAHAMDHYNQGRRIL